jgi:hypothetical protein
MPVKSNHPMPPKSAKKFGHFSGEPIFIPLDELSKENPPPQENPAGPKFFIIGGLILALLCAWSLAPAQMDALWQNLLHQLFHFAGQ